MISFTQVEFILRLLPTSVKEKIQTCRDSLIMSYFNSLEMSSVRLWSSKGDRYEGMFEHER